MNVKILRSHKRNRTISAKVEGDTMYVYAPSDMPEDELNKIITNFTTRFEKRKLRKELNKTHNLMPVAQELNKVYFGSKLEIKSIEYTATLNHAFGSCVKQAGKILISHRLSEMPTWVRDYVIVHELAHLIESNHSEAFWNLVYRYKLTERAIGYLIAKGIDTDDDESQGQEETADSANCNVTI